MVNFCVELLLVLVITNAAYCYKYGSPFFTAEPTHSIHNTIAGNCNLAYPKIFLLFCLYSLNDMLYVLRGDVPFILVIIR